MSINCDRHDLPSDRCGYCKDEEIDQLRAENDRLKAENELYAAEMSAAREAGFYSAQELFMAYKNMEAKLAEKEAEILKLNQMYPATAYTVEIEKQLAEAKKDAARLRADFIEKNTLIVRLQKELAIYREREKTMGWNQG